MSLKEYLILFPYQMDELACFVPGMLALGSSSYDPGEAEKFMSLAEEVNLLYNTRVHILLKT